VVRQIMEPSRLLSKGADRQNDGTGHPDANTTIEAGAVQAANRCVDSFDAPGVVW